MVASQATAHPDRHGQSSEQEQQDAADHAADITDAYSVLKAPHLRAVHLLELLGTPLDEETSGDVLGPEFLMEVLEIREELEEPGLQPDRLLGLREVNNKAVAALHSRLCAAFGTHELVQAQALTARLQYLQRIDEEILAKMPVT